MFWMFMAYIKLRIISDLHSRLIEKFFFIYLYIYILAYMKKNLNFFHILFRSDCMQQRSQPSYQTIIFKLYMIEFIQLLVYERYHKSPLSELLLERALRNPNVVGHEFFWLLSSQLHVKVTFERFALIIEQFFNAMRELQKRISSTNVGE